MANTYTQLYVQYIFAVQNRNSLIQPEWEETLYRYVTGIVRNHDHKVLAINGMPDHVHLFVSMHPTQAPSDLMRITKGESSEWINHSGKVKGRFKWQEGFAAFTYSRSHIDRVCRYVMNQKKHHRKKTFIDEYLGFLERFEVPYDERHIFQPVE